jgi:hypothetical protein
LQTANPELQITNIGLQIINHELLITNLELQTIKPALQIANPGLPILTGASLFIINALLLFNALPCFSAGRVY